MAVKNWSMEWAGRTLSVEIGKVALLPQASCVVRYGDTVLLATVVLSKNKREGIDFFPLSVEFEEKLYAAGKIKGSRFIKREGRPTDEAILSGRMVDRAIRPLFDARVRNDTQVILTALSVDGENDSQIPALFAASLALSISPIPWAGPIAGARVGRVDGQFVLNPTFAQREQSDLDLLVAGAPEKVIMLEAGCKEISEADVLAATQYGAAELGAVIKFIEKIVSEIGQEKIDLFADLSDEEKKLREAETDVKKFVGEHVADWIFDAPKAGRPERVAMVDKFTTEIEKILKEKEADEAAAKVILGRVKIYIEEYISERILTAGQRLDGRGLTEIRELKTEVGLLPRTHGSGLFSRGDTQVLSVVTLGAPGDVQTLDTMEEDGTKRYMHHYNDTPATYAETGPMRGPGRRAIGHGALAERALEPVLPSENDFPYAIRVVSEVLGSNGSSSMASTCGSSLALMDAGVPLKKPVAGVAMGLASNNKGDWKVITDLQDVEDGPGGMDFKITGTDSGITAIQMDTKTNGLSWEIVKQTFAQAKEARLEILTAMAKVMPEPRKEMSPYAPRIITIRINPDKIRDVIGPGGKMINKIIAETGVSIDIEDDGRVFVTSTDAVGMAKAVKWVEELTHEVTAGEVYDGAVVRIEDFGAFVNILPGQDGLVHVSEIGWNHVNRPGDALNIGDKVKVIVREIDNLGRINLSIKQLMEKPVGYVERPTFERGVGGARGPRFGGGGFGGRGGDRGGRGPRGPRR
ncbi:polyribonucleotide nucleotidyltransferase [Patescibacteria group bacterium]|nr:MAG: polyribonucleotide nucleotidyltransferase [Patescibacteria group bacterium]